jgi:hypothetical protein
MQDFVQTTPSDPPKQEQGELPFPKTEERERPPWPFPRSYEEQKADEAKLAAEHQADLERELEEPEDSDAAHAVEAAVADTVAADITTVAAAYARPTAVDGRETKKQQAVLRKQARGLLASTAHIVVLIGDKKVALGLSPGQCAHAVNRAEKILALNAELDQAFDHGKRAVQAIIDGIHHVRNGM